MPCYRILRPWQPRDLSPPAHAARFVILHRVENQRNFPVLACVFRGFRQQFRHSFRVVSAPSVEVRVLKKSRFLICAAAALAVAVALAGCGKTEYFAGRKLPPSGLLHRVMVVVQNASILSHGEASILDAYYDTRSGYTGTPGMYSISGYGGNLPVSIHCLQAWGRLLEVLRDGPRPRCGFLLHSYGGPREMIAPLAALGAYFSFPGYFAHDRKARQREAFKHVPPDRLLIETDAPDQPLPDERVRYPLSEAGSGKALNHPANLGAVYDVVAELLDEPPESLARRVEENFARLFGGLAALSSLKAISARPVRWARARRNWAKGESAG